MMKGSAPPVAPLEPPAAQLKQAASEAYDAGYAAGRRAQWRRDHALQKAAAAQQKNGCAQGGSTPAAQASAMPAAPGTVATDPPAAAPGTAPFAGQAPSANPAPAPAQPDSGAPAYAPSGPAQKLAPADPF